MRLLNEMKNVMARPEGIDDWKYLPKSKERKTSISNEEGAFLSGVELSDRSDKSDMSLPQFPIL